jgi:ABC-type Fe3+-citrate transport system substrate-binding protein
MKYLILFIFPVFSFAQCPEAKKITDDMGGGSFYRTSVKCNPALDYADKIISTGQELIVKLGNEEFIKLKSKSNYAGKIYQTTGSNMTAFIAIYSITKVQLENIILHGIKKIRLFTTEGFEEFEIKDKYQEEIKSAATCIVK